MAKRCVEKGHDVASHGWRWIDYHDLSVEVEERMVRKAVESLKALTGYAPKGWYYGRGSPQSRTLVPRVYEEMGEELVWFSDTYADDVSTDIVCLGSRMCADFLGAILGRSCRSERGPKLQGPADGVCCPFFLRSYLR